MYIEFFQLKEMPFSITPDPAYLYMSPRHQEALGHLLYGTGQYGGFVQLTGEVGTGKTTIVRTLLEQKLDKVRSEEHTSELQSLMRISYAVFCLKKKNTKITPNNQTTRN